MARVPMYRSTDVWEDVALDTSSAQISDATHLVFKKNTTLKRARVSGYATITLNAPAGSNTYGYTSVSGLFKNAKPTSDTVASFFATDNLLNGYVYSVTGALVIASAKSGSNTTVYVSGEWDIA